MAQASAAAERWSWPASATTVLVARNPKAGSGGQAARVGQFLAALQAQGLQTEVLTDLALLAERAPLLHQQGQLRAVVAAGGDGTVHAVVNRLAANELLKAVPLVVLPLGTANLLARQLDLNRGPAQVAAALQTGLVRVLDVGLAGTQRFVLMLGCGFDAEVIGRLHAERRGNISLLTYAKPIWEAVRSYAYPLVRVRALHSEGAPNILPPDLAVRWVFVQNLPCYAARILVAPQASGTDGYLDLCTFAQGGWLTGLWYLGSIWLGQHRRLTDFAWRAVTRVRIEADAPVPYQLDGDPGGWLPVDVEVLPRRLACIVGSAGAG